MKEPRIPDGFCWEYLDKRHNRSAFQSREPAVDDWLRTKALQNQQKRLSNSFVLVADADRIAGFYTLAAGQVDLSELAPELARKLPKRAVPVAILAWMGVHYEFQGQGLGERILAQALRDCYESSRHFAFVAVFIDCLNDRVKSFYQRWNFRECPGHRLRLYLSFAELVAMMSA